MENGVSKIDLLRLVGFMAVCVGLAWAVQVLGFGRDGSAFGRMLWVLGAASIAGAGAGAIFTASSLREKDGLQA